MLTKIKIHSAFSHLFSYRELVADLKTYDELPRYLGSMHPRFAQFVKKIYTEETQDGYFLLNKNFKPITEQELYFKRVKEDDSFYVVPAIYGGGGKGTKKLLTYAAIATAAVIAAPYVASAASSIFAGGPANLAITGGFGPGGAGGGVAAQLAGSSAAAGSAGLGISAGTLAVNAGLALVTSLFTQKPEALTSRDQQVRQNNMFGSLQNTIDSGVSIPLIYGQHRVAGQFISGYLESIDHGQNDDVTVLEQFEDE